MKSDAIHARDVAMARVEGDLRRHMLLVIEVHAARQHVNLDPRQRLTLGVDGIAQMDGLLLAGQQRPALDQPFVS